MVVLDNPSRCSPRNHLCTRTPNCRSSKPDNAQPCYQPRIHRRPCSRDESTSALSSTCNCAKDRTRRFFQRSTGFKESYAKRAERCGICLGLPTYHKRLNGVDRSVTALPLFYQKTKHRSAKAILNNLPHNKYSFQSSPLGAFYILAQIKAAPN